MTYSDFLHFVRSKKIKNHSRFFDMVPLNLTVSMTLRLAISEKVQKHDHHGLAKSSAGLSEKYICKVKKEDGS